MVIKVPNNIKLKDLFIDIHCIGRSPQGEGILIIIRKDDYVIYSGLIDECIDEKIIERENIEKLNFICWTHPHDDHTNGIKQIINKKTFEQTKIIVPNGISDVAKRMTSLCKKTYRPIKKLNRNGKKKNGRYVEANEYTNLNEETYIDNDGNNIKIQLRTISPICKRVNNLRNNKNINMNDLSICLILLINNIKFLFTSDIYNNIINDMEIQDELFENIVYYKIPHHGSVKSDRLLQYIPKVNQNKIAVTTIYKNNGENVTPNITLMNKYLEKGLNLFCTSESCIKDTQNRESFGIISTRIKLPNNGCENKLDWDIKLEGEAIEIADIVQEDSYFIPNVI